jgi:hypothetical protein
MRCGGDLCSWLGKVGRLVTEPVAWICPGCLETSTENWQHLRAPVFAVCAAVSPSKYGSIKCSAMQAGVVQSSVVLGLFCCGIRRDCAEMFFDDEGKCAG